MEDRRNENSLIYDIEDSPKHWYEWLIYSIQMVMSVFVATILIAQVCGTPIDAALLGACLGTLVYQLITGFKSPMFISSSGAMTSAVVGALALGNAGPNYFAVFIGGLVTLFIYALFALVIKWKGIEILNRIFPPVIVGPVTIIIGLNLAKFIPGYVGMDGPYPIANTCVAIFTALIIAGVSHYGKTFAKSVPFLAGLAMGCVLSAILTVCGIPMIDFSLFKDMSFFRVPDISFLHWGESIQAFSWEVFGEVLLLFVPVSICALLEHYSDHKVLSNILNRDLTKTPGLHKTLLGDGVASAVGTAICGLPNTSYGESIATIGFSKVASVKIVSVAALILGFFAFFEPLQVILQAIPSAVFGGCAMILYGYIAASGLKTLRNNKIDLEENGNLITISVILTTGISGVFLFTPSFGGTSLAMVLGVIFNILFNFKQFFPKKKKKDVNFKSK